MGVEANFNIDVAVITAVVLIVIGRNEQNLARVEGCKLIRWDNIQANN
jgi:hypothetical protein